MASKKGPKVLFIDIETKPLLVFAWGIGEQYIAANQIASDRCLLSWSAKWAGDPDSKIMYADSRGKKNVEDDKHLLEGIWKLLNEAEVVVGQNSKRFDIKVLNSRFIENNMDPPSGYEQEDTLQMARKKFGFVSNSLDYLTDKLCKKHKKSKHKKFFGMSLWLACMAGNQEAWKEMESYNKKDVLCTEELYGRLAPWSGTSTNYSLYFNGEDTICSCGNNKFKKNGFKYTKTGQFQRYACTKCGHEVRDRQSLLSKEKKASLKV